MARPDETAANYQTPLGSFRTWEEAAAACERADLDPCECIEYVGGPKRAIPTTCIEHAYGSTFRLSFQIKVF